jgi:exopolysaccharide biosynthesis WecB/TagA/CpsF family protein
MRAQNNVLTKILHDARHKSLYVSGVRVDTVTVETVLEAIHASTGGATDDLTRCVFFTNVHTIQLAHHDAEFRRTVNDGDLVLPDGIGLKIAARVFGTIIPSNLNGTDLSTSIFRYADAMKRSVYLFGARPGVLARCRDRIATDYPGLTIAGARHGYFSPRDEESIIGDINSAKPDILLVAMGSPMQETWLLTHRHRLNARIALAVGGLFDFVSGTIQRAPAWMRRAGCEWLYRFCQDPKTKWNRVCVEIPAFLARTCASRLVPSRRVRFVTRGVALQ